MDDVDSELHEAESHQRSFLHDNALAIWGFIIFVFFGTRMQFFQDDIDKMSKKCIMNIIKMRLELIVNCFILINGPMFKS